jgi:hypothetical protein
MPVELASPPEDATVVSGSPPPDLPLEGVFDLSTTLPLQFDLETVRQKCAAGLAMLREWELEDQTDDPAELERRRQDWVELRSALNESRRLDGRPPVFAE